MAREDYMNKDFVYFDITSYPMEGKEVIDLDEVTVAILQEGHRVQINQLDVFAKNEYQYDKVFLDRQTILDLADYIRNNG